MSFIDRLIEEERELDIKIEKLDEFLLSDKAKDIDPEQLALLNIQVTAMETYSRVLKQRLFLLSEPLDKSIPEFTTDKGETFVQNEDGLYELVK